LGIKNLLEKGVIEVWEDLYEAKLDDKAAPDLADVVKGKEQPIYSEPEEFFKRTYMTRSIIELIDEVAETLRGSSGGKIFLLTSLFGGGKTHTHISLYHAFNNPEKLRVFDSSLAAKVAGVGKPIIIVMDGTMADLVPHPSQPFRTEGFTIKTIWGMLAFRLGAYAKIRHLDSEKEPAPDVTLIKSILQEPRQPILILMDEIVHYIFNVHKSPQLKDYGEKVILFLDYLARAIEDIPKIALIASVQAEYKIEKGQKILLEEEVFKGYASKVLSVLSRETTKTTIPVSPDDVVNVLQRRIFKNVPEEEAWKAREKLYRIYREAPELFGVESDWEYSPENRIVSAKDTYPFHPKYVEVLQEFVTRNRDLQKTRDAIRITRKVTRRLLRRGEDADFIMPWHIDLGDNDIRSRVLTESYKEFSDVASRNIISEAGKMGLVNECSKPELALKIATAVLLKTYTYETFKEPLKVFPDLKTVALMVYDPETFKAKNFHHLDIEMILNEMHGRLPHFVSEAGRYWFTPFPSVIEYVEKKAVEKLFGSKLELYEVLKEKVKGLILKKEKKGLVERGEVFNESNTIVIGYGEEIGREIIIEDNASMRLVVIVRPDIDEEEVRKIILFKGESGKRIYRNTIAVVCPHKETNFEELLLLAAKIKAAEDVMGSLSEYYKDKEIKNLQEGKLKKYIQEKENLLNQHLLTALTRIAYPSRSAVGDDIKWVNTLASTSIIAQVEAGLKDPATGPKLRLDFSFKDLADFLKVNQNLDLIEGSKPHEFRDIINVFYHVTAAPFTTRAAIERAIREGIEKLDIGVKVNGELYWKLVGPDDGSNLPIKELEDSAEILPYKIAANILKDMLLNESGEKKIDKQVQQVWYEVEVANRKIRLEDLILQNGWEKVLKVGIILRQEKIIERGFLLNVSPSSINVRQGEKVQVKVRLNPVDEYLWDVELKVTAGEIKPSRGKVPLEASWEISTLQDPGEQKFIIEAIGEDGSHTSSFLTVFVESLEEEIDVESLDISWSGAKLIHIIPRNLISLKMALDTISKLNPRAEANITINFGDNISFKGNNIDVKLAGLFVQRFIDIIIGLPSLEKELKVDGNIEFKDPVVLDSSRIAALTPISNNAIFKLRVEKK